MLAKPKKPSRTALKAKCDILASRYYRALTPYCELALLDGISCGGGLQWAHIIGRANLRLRYEPFNNLVLCGEHHRWYGVNPGAWVRVLETHYPDRLSLAERHRHEIVKTDYTAWIDRFTKLPDSQN